MNRPPAEHIDTLLRDFLESEKRARAKGITLEALHSLVRDIADDRLQDRQTLFRYGRRLKALERQMEIVTERPEVPVQPWQPDPAEITGTWQFQQVTAQLNERKSDARWLKRKGIEWLIAGLGALVMALLGVVGFLVSRLIH